MSQLVDIVREMVMAMVRLEKRSMEVDTPTEISKLDRVLPLPPPPTQFAHVPNAPPAVGLYVMPTPRTD